MLNQEQKDFALEVLEGLDPLEQEQLDQALSYVTSFLRLSTLPEPARTATRRIVQRAWEEEPRRTPNTTIGYEAAIEMLSLPADGAEEPDDES